MDYRVLQSILFPMQGKAWLNFFLNNSQNQICEFSGEMILPPGWVMENTTCLPAGSRMGQALTMLVSLTPSWWHWENAARQSYCCFCPLTANSSNGESKILHCPVILLIIQHHLCSSLFNRTLSLDAIRVRAEYKLYTTFLVLASLAERWKRTGLVIG